MEYNCLYLSKLLLNKYAKNIHALLSKNKIHGELIIKQY